MGSHRPKQTMLIKSKLRSPTRDLFFTPISERKKGINVGRSFEYALLITRRKRNYYPNLLLRKWKRQWAYCRPSTTLILVVNRVSLVDVTVEDETWTTISGTVHVEQWLEHPECVPMVCTLSAYRIVSCTNVEEREAARCSRHCPLKGDNVQAWPEVVKNEIHRLITDGKRGF